MDGSLSARAQIEIDAPADVVWSLIAEFRHWSTWGPSVRGVDVDADAVATGVRGRVQTAIGLWLPFEITDVEDERTWSWTVAGIPATGHRVVELTPGRSRVEFTAPWLLAPYVFVLRAALRKLKALAEERGA